jgi:hypothetical protein
VKTKLALQPLVDAVNARDAAKAKGLLAAEVIANDPRMLEIGRRFAGTMSPGRKQPVAAATKSVPLSDMPASEEKTGYGRAVRDRLPVPEGLLASGGKVFPHGFYAHAPARHVWNLDGTWKSLTGNAGLADGFDGSVKFVIEGDGKPLWQSELVKSGKSLPFQVDLTGIKQLTLRTEDGGNGNREDWALWLEPVLAR